MAAALAVHFKSQQKVVRQKGSLALVKSIDQALDNSEALHSPISPVQTPSTSTARPGIPHQVIHSIPGRLRLRLPRLGCDAHYVYRLQMLLEADEYITEIRMKPQAMSVALHYHGDRVSVEEMQQHLGNLIDLAATAIVPAPGADGDGEAESAWSELKLPLVASLLALLAGPMGLPIPTLAVVGTIAVGSLPVAQKALESLWQDKRINIDCLDLMALTLTTLQGNPLTPSTILLLHKLGDLIRDRTARSTTRHASELIDSLDRVVWVERDGMKVQIALDRVRPGDTVIVYPGEQIPIDGSILRGQATIDQQKLTGESVPVRRSVGDPVYASTLVREGHLYILTEKTGLDTRAGQSITLVREAPVGDTRMENYAAQLADKAILPAFAFSTGVLVVTGSMARAAAILTLDFMTGIRVSVPTTVLASMSAAARRGILIRSGRSLEQLAHVDAVVFDKTGTLTQGDVVVTEVRTIHGADPRRLLAFAATAERRLTHPIACALLNYAQECGVEALERDGWDYQVGLGVRAIIEGEEVRVGCDRFMAKEQIDLERIYEVYPDLRGSAAIYVASNGELLGAIEYTDPLRPETKATIQALQAQGIDIHILTGDCRQRAVTVASQLGIATENIHADAFPEQKAVVVRELHESGKTVAFVGDGINDSAALAYADVSVSFGEGSEVARETADVVLMENDLESLVKAIALAQQTQQLIGENTRLSVIPNVAALLLATTVGLHPLAAAVVHNGSAIAAGVNGLRPLLQGREN